MIHVPFRYCHPNKVIHKIECSIHITGYSQPLFSTDIDVFDRMIYILVDDLKNITSEFDFDYVRQYDNIFRKTKIIEDCVKLPLYIEFESKNEFIKWKLKL